MRRLGISHEDLPLVRFELEDFPLVRSSVMQMARGLDADHFITSDIDTVLPQLLEPGKGLVYGGLSGSKVVATQAVEFDALHGIPLRESLRALLPETRMESGWALVSPNHRRRGLSRRLHQALETDAVSETRARLCLATIHPTNAASLRLYFKLGYVGVDSTTHFGVPRVILLKHLGRPIRTTRSKGTRSTAAENDERTQAQLLHDGFVCVWSEDRQLYFVEADVSGLLGTGDSGGELP
jgi:GNAT superfamily N-acetyltransferase